MYRLLKIMLPLLATAAPTYTAANGSTSVEIALIGGGFLILNTILTVFLSRYVERHTHVDHSRETTAKNARADRAANRDTRRRIR